MPQERIAAQQEMDVIWTAFYAAMEVDHPWWWIRSILVDPLAVIVDTGDDLGLVRMTITVNGDDITFGEAEPVRVEYAPKGSDGGKVAASGKPQWRVAAAYKSDSATRPDTTTGDTMDVHALREALGDRIADDASDEAVLAFAADALLAGSTPGTSDGDGDEPTAPTTEPAPDAAPAPVAVAASGLASVVDNDRLAQLEADAALGRQAAQTLASQHRASVIGEHRKRGALTKASAPAWDAEYAAAQARDAARGDGQPTEAARVEELLKTLASGKGAPVDGEVGDGRDTETSHAAAHSPDAHANRMAMFPQYVKASAATDNTKGA